MNAIVYGLFSVGLIGFILMAAGFGRLFAQAWRMPNRWKAVRRALCVRPRRTPGWPDSSAGAGLIARGALCGVVFFVGLLALLSFAPKCFQ